MVQLHFTDNEYTLNFDIDLADYISNAATIQNNTKMLEEKCKAHFNTTNCNFFLHNFREISTLTKNEVHFITSPREKRFIIASVIMLGTTIFSAIVGYFVSTAISNNNVAKEVAEQINVHRDTKLAELKFSEKQLIQANKTMNALYDLANDFERDYTINTLINQLVTTTLVCIVKHNKATERFMHALSDSLQTDF